MRKKIRANCICSSADYSGSRRAHLVSLQINHEKHIEHIREMTKDIVVEKHYTEVKVWGKWIKINGPIERYEGFELR